VPNICRQSLENHQGSSDLFSSFFFFFGFRNLSRKEHLIDDSSSHPALFPITTFYAFVLMRRAKRGKSAFTTSRCGSRRREESNKGVAIVALSSTFQRFIISRHDREPCSVTWRGEEEATVIQQRALACARSHLRRDVGNRFDSANENGC